MLHLLNCCSDNEYIFVLFDRKTANIGKSVSSADNIATTDDGIPCVDCVEIRPTAEQLSQTPETLKHGLILFAGGQEIVHLKSDVLIDDLIEDEIAQRLNDEREAREQKAKAENRSSNNSQHHATDLIPGVYEGKQYKNHNLDNRSKKRSKTNNGLNHKNAYERKNDSRYPDKRILHEKRSYEDDDNADSRRRHRHSHRSERQHDIRRRSNTPPTFQQRKNERDGGGRSRNEHRHPWFNAELAGMIALREKAHRRWRLNKRRQRNDANWEEFRRCRSAVSAARRTLRNDYLAAALHVDRLAPMPWQTKGIPVWLDLACIHCVYMYLYFHMHTHKQTRNIHLLHTFLENPKPPLYFFGDDYEQRVHEKHMYFNIDARFISRHNTQIIQSKALTSLSYQSVYLSIYQFILCPLCLLAPNRAGCAQDISLIF